MSLARAFTTRRAKHSVDLGSSEAMPQRSNTTARGSIRHKISAPVELIHTTNMLSYNAPDLFPKTTSAGSPRSDDESDSAPTTASTPPTSPDTPFPDNRATSPEPNHLSCYFTAPKQAPPADAAEASAPVIPARAPSHTKKSYDGLGLTRHRSASRLSEQSARSVSTKASFSFSRSSSTSTATSAHTSVSLAPTRKASTASLSTPPLPPPVSSSAVAAALHKKEYSDTHPFGQELAQVSELAEEYASTREEDDEDALPIMNPEVHEPVPALPAAPVAASRPAAAVQNRVLDQEERDLLKMGLRKFSADDYLSEIRGLASLFFVEASRPVAAMWI